MRQGAHIGYVQGRLAITSGWGGGPDLCAVVGPARALRMMSRSEPVPAATALAWGLVDAVVPADAVETGLRDFIAPMLEQTRTVLAGFKAQALAARRGDSYEARRASERDYFVTEHWAASDAVLARSKDR
jgi:enoyl-CoA hydratase/carnithine racemase